jgi:hypothetical protein
MPVVLLVPVPVVLLCVRPPVPGVDSPVDVPPVDDPPIEDVPPVPAEPPAAAPPVPPVPPPPPPPAAKARLLDAANTAAAISVLIFMMSSFAFSLKVISCGGLDAFL